MDRSGVMKGGSGLKLHAVGLEPVTILGLREAGYEVIAYTEWPETEEKAGIWIVTSFVVPVSELTRLRVRFPEVTLVYWYQTPGIAGWQAVHALCLQQEIRFLRPGIGTAALLDAVKAWFHHKAASSPHVVGVFGTTPGGGCTRVAATIAQAMTRLGKKVILLGMNLFHPGWEGETAVSLDEWRQRLIGRMLQPGDLDRLIRTHGFAYLPGNFDLLSALDYTEEELAHLLQVACQQADVVIADCGAIPESAAWFCGMQRAGLRILVTHPQQLRSLRALIGLAETMEVPAGHLFLCGNRMRGEDMPLKQLAAETGTQPWFSFPDKGDVRDFTLPLGRREQDALDGAIRPLLAALGEEMPGKRRGGL